MEYCEKGDLSQYLERIGSQMEISEQRLQKIIIQICSALNYIHDKNIVHADLKP